MSEENKDVIKEENLNSEAGKNVEHPKAEKINWKKEIFSWIRLIVIVLAVVFCVKQFVIVNAVVPSTSMMNLIEVGDRLIGFRLAYAGSATPQRYDVVIFKYPVDESENYIKRVIGLPGETVEIKNGKIYIDGSSEPLDEPYLPETMKGSYGPYVVPEGCFFMMGDNRNHSWDSREWDNTYVTKKQIYAKAWLRYKPSLGLIESAEYGE